MVVVRFYRLYRGLIDMSLVVANALSYAEEYAVIGIDLPFSYWKRFGRSMRVPFPVIADDPKIEQFYKFGQENLMLPAIPAYSLANVIIVDINLDVKKRSLLPG